MTDLAVANVYSNRVRVLLGLGNGTFGGPASYAVGFDPNSVTAGDFNGDGVTDLATANSNSLHGGSVSVLLGLGDGSFLDQASYPLSDRVRSIKSGDFNDDGLVDLVTVSARSGSVTVLVNRVACVELPGDVNQDGVVDLFDVAPFVAVLVSGEFQAEADINEDGRVDLLDIAPFVDLLTGG